jgi:hypothetical protein
MLVGDDEQSRRALELPDDSPRRMPGAVGITDGTEWKKRLGWAVRQA